MFLLMFLIVFIFCCTNHTCHFILIFLSCYFLSVCVFSFHSVGVHTHASGCPSSSSSCMCSPSFNTLMLHGSLLHFSLTGPRSSGNYCHLLVVEKALHLSVSTLTRGFGFGVKWRSFVETLYGCLPSWIGQKCVVCLADYLAVLGDDLILKWTRAGLHVMLQTALTFCVAIFFVGNCFY